jgi:hypothetical protein
MLISIILSYQNYRVTSLGRVSEEVDIVADALR